MRRPLTSSMSVVFLSRAMFPVTMTAATALLAPWNTWRPRLWIARGTTSVWTGGAPGEGNGGKGMNAEFWALRGFQLDGD